MFLVDLSILYLRFGAVAPISDGYREECVDRPLSPTSRRQAVGFAGPSTTLGGLPADLTCGDTVEAGLILSSPSIRSSFSTVG